MSDPIKDGLLLNKLLNMNISLYYLGILSISAQDNSFHDPTLTQPLNGIGVGLEVGNLFYP